mmetsp:Transcript_12348/g.33849  ORF Transcript_12348/g.33849 Transcript_12348/m.33849 type:complete len:221 (-) Transcript_12348:254-916(-)
MQEASDIVASFSCVQDTSVSFAASKTNFSWVTRPVSKVSTTTKLPSPMSSHLCSFRPGFWRPSLTKPMYRVQNWSGVMLASKASDSAQVLPSDASALSLQTIAPSFPARLRTSPSREVSMAATPASPIRCALTSAQASTRKGEDSSLMWMVSLSSPSSKDLSNILVLHSFFSLSKVCLIRSFISPPPNMPPFTTSLISKEPSSRSLQSWLVTPPPVRLPM